ncbi:hypothetical protein TanjilG_13291 [Lupinus angustifolius]|uniref:PHD-type domain-containing protein n=1 Tax=Lupinus angustifolius TaxID=3871 RepID=A0A4P1RU96_LUPAN|nr:PREDICTED: uncharacterized protein LOC109353993 [Lupinus angustifolius]OIW18539.1 hypothetical protein TanjilG_13291 [Lupinus angustifolius]
MMNSPKKRLKSELINNDDEEQVCCGICYAERGGGSIAGEIDCCNHFFCFVCIMEWAKHESRCPICRQRFSNVRRPSKLGLFSSSRDVKVPLRDQVYHLYGNMSTGPVVSNAQGECSICHGVTDESLLLLCDLCDTASHTYCVGLGYTVPEGDWFCPDCAISIETRAKQELDQQNVVLTDEPTVAAFDIARELSSHRIIRSRESPVQQNLSSPFVIPLPDRIRRFKGKNPVSGPQHVQRNIQALRENWSALRSGSLRFRSFQSSESGSHEQASSSSSCGKSNKSHSTASTSLQKSTVQGGPSSSMLNERGLHDVDMAWKMLDRAKTMQKTHQRTSSVDRPSCSGVARKISNARCNYLEMKNQRSRTSGLTCATMEKQGAQSSLNQNFENHWSPRSGKKNRSEAICEDMIQHTREHTHAERYYEPPMSGKVHASIQNVPHHDNAERNVANEQSSPAGLATSVGSALSHGKFDSAFSSIRNEHVFNEEKWLAKSFVDGNTRNSEHAKTEIQSLVKQNLKLLTRDKLLDVDTFKAVARKATHTILAACTSELQNSDVYSTSLVCSHTEQTQQFQKSTLISNYCQQCFHHFVNNVVKSTMLEKVGGRV